MNPMLTQLRGNNSNMIGLLSGIKNGNPNVIFDQLYRTNPQFKKFVDANKGKTAEQIAVENGIDLNSINSLIG